jgi:hypothetical protein
MGKTGRDQGAPRSRLGENFSEKEKREFFAAFAKKGARGKNLKPTIESLYGCGPARPIRPDASEGRAAATPLASKGGEARVGALRVDDPEPSARPYHSLRATAYKLATARSWSVSMAAPILGDTTRIAEAYYGTLMPGELDELMRERPPL